MYGYSVWLVPLNYRILQKVYKFRHIPHVTISTNHSAAPDPANLGRLYDVTDFQPYSNIGRNYVIDPLHALGWVCQVHGLEIEHTPHMSHVYSFFAFPRSPHVSYATPTRLIAEVCVADTRSPRPEEWEIIGEKLPRRH